jgi:palmitoyltransferase
MCVGRMDHHCNFVGKCIGASNYKSFFIFVLSVVGMMTLTFTQTTLTFWWLENCAKEAEGLLNSVILYMAAYAFIATFLLFYALLLIFLARHMTLTARGKTSIEDTFEIDSDRPTQGIFFSLKLFLGGFWGLPLAAFGDKWEAFLQLGPYEDPEIVDPLEIHATPSFHKKETLGHFILRFPD